MTFLWFILSFNVFVVCTYAIPNIHDARIEHKKCYGKDISVAHMAFGLSFEECLTECQHRNVCVGIRYHPRSKHCSVLDGLALDALENLNNKCLFVNISFWMMSESNSCANHACSLNEKCIPSDGDPESFECEKSECSPPPTVENAFHLSQSRTIGSKNRYRCTKDYNLVGNPEIVCQDNYEWTTPTFTCVKKCRRPKATYQSAELVGVSSNTNFGSGTKLEFQCKPGYNMAQKQTSNVCNINENGPYWNGYAIECCPDDHFYIIGWRWCVMPPYPIGNVTTYAGKMLYIYELGIAVC